MEKIVLIVKDTSKFRFLLELIKQFDFVEVQKPSSKQKSKKKYDLFASAGLWKDREIDAKELREKAWARTS